MASKIEHLGRANRTPSYPTRRQKNKRAHTKQSRLSDTATYGQQFPHSYHSLTCRCRLHSGMCLLYVAICLPLNNCEELFCAVYAIYFPTYCPNVYLYIGRRFNNYLFSWFTNMLHIRKVSAAVPLAIDYIPKAVNKTSFSI